MVLLQDCFEVDLVSKFKTITGISQFSIQRQWLEQVRLSGDLWTPTIDYFFYFYFCDNEIENINTIIYLYFE